jgi:beta-lactamase superfamily II metal-dependent hydrolase
MHTTEINKVQERLYIIRWTFEGIKENEKRVETYQWEQRQEALTRYMKLRDQWYASDLKFQIAQPQDVNVDQFLNSF